MSKVYCLKQKGNTNEYHLFECTPTKDSCSCPTKSICGKMNKSESKQNKFTCKSIDVARKKCAEIGYTVCGTCASHLYKTY